jgi:isopenicillin-N N-acyltransferase-like protein
MYGGKLRVVELSGDPAERGFTHGSTYGSMIRKYLDDRLGLAAEEGWSGGVAERDLILDIAEETLGYHERYSTDLHREMLAMAQGADITLAEAVVVGGFTDLVDVVRSRVGVAPDEHNCTAVVNPGAAVHAQTWDMHASAGEFVLLLDVRPDGGPRALVQTTAGCLGQIGMNEAGISIGINNLTAMGRPGVTWPTVVREALAQVDFDDAVDAVIRADLAGGHNFMLMGPNGNAVNIEAMPANKRVTVVGEPYVHTNHCVDQLTAAEEGERLAEHVENSNIRLNVGAKLAEDLEGFFEEPLISRRVDGPHDVGTCGAVVMEPSKRRMRAVWGVPGDHPWETFDL